MDSDVSNQSRESSELQIEWMNSVLEKFREMVVKQDFVNADHLFRSNKLF